MQSPFTQGEAHLEIERSRHYKGTAKIDLEEIGFHPDSSQSVEQHVIDRLCAKFQKEGCRRLDAQNHVTAIISLQDLRAALQTAGKSLKDLSNSDPNHLPHLRQLEHFARTRSQPIWIFPASHTRTKPTDATTTRLKAEDLLKQTDQGTKIPFPGLFLYSRNMPAVMLTNVCTRIGQVNGAAGTAVGVVLDPAGKCCLSQYKILDTLI